ncbi:amidase [Pseudomonas sp. M30-35]|uniref:amidase n=1 Tax=Pseudomonas sp. M30-35 TaxID=1981174 RepID=UPI000B3C5E99|nr:amidase [Pseudomonas sp. M30-35]ARU87981.1 amidase [Pseudomonas sp. M30-35]
MPKQPESELTTWSACELANEIRSGHLSARELTEACLAKIAQHNPTLNALVTLDAEGALRKADAADQRQARGESLGPLHGLPIAHKDSFLTAGMRTTWGSKIYAEHVPTQDSLIVTRQAQAGSILLGKSNLPEFGAGSQTFNSVFGATRNPYAPSKTCGGSSGGAAVALASGMVALADGSDMGGSLRNPASFCNVVGLRPSVGRVPNLPNNNSFGQLTVAGPMGRCVADVALLLSVIAGPDRRDPLTIESPANQFRDLAQDDWKHARIAYSPDLGGLPVDPAVRAMTEIGAKRIADLGCTVEHAEPDFSGAAEAFQVLRALTYATGYGHLLKTQRQHFKDTVIWNVELAQRFSSQDVIDAEAVRARLFRDTQALLERYDFIIAPVSQVLPFPVEQPFVERIGEQSMNNYIEWMNSCSLITLSGHPAISVPCGFSDDGLPVGLQIIGRYRDELTLLKFAQAFETISKPHTTRPLA